MQQVGKVKIQGHRGSITSAQAQHRGRKGVGAGTSGAETVWMCGEHSWKNTTTAMLEACFHTHVWKHSKLEMMLGYPKCNNKVEILNKRQRVHAGSDKIANCQHISYSRNHMSDQNT